MKVYVVESLIGIAAYDDDGNLIAYSSAPKDLDELVEYLLNLEEGREIPQLSEVINKLKEVGVSEAIVETEAIAKYFSSSGIKPKLEPGHQFAVLLRYNLPKYAVEYGFSVSEDDFLKLLHTTLLELTRRKLRRAAEKRDLLAVQAIRAIDDIDKTINLFVARLREWYSLHFPELDDLIREHPDFVKIVAELGHREAISKDKLIEIGFRESKAEKIVDAARKSIGADLSDFDIAKIQTLAKIIAELYRLRIELADYIDAVMKEVAPNITALVGPLLGARLLSLAGGLESLARLPASTIQVLGAEKALFRALRTGGKPPKHGVIFQYPAIHRSPRWQRGKIARALAAKLAIAAKVDYFSGRHIGDRLKEEVEKRIDEIKKLYAKPPIRRREEERREKRPPRRGRRRRGRRRKRK